MKKIFLVFTILVLAVSVKAQFVNTTWIGNNQTQWGQTGALGAGYGIQVRFSFPDTASANASSVGGSVGFLKNIKGFIIRVGDDWYSRSEDLQRWNKINGGSSGALLTASNGLTATGTNVKLGGTLVENTTIAGGGFTYTMNNLNGYFITSTDDMELRGTATATTLVGLYDTDVQLSSSQSGRASVIDIYPDTIILKPSLGNFYIDTLNNETFQNSLMGWTTTSGANRGKVGYITLGTGGSINSGVLNFTGTAIPISSLTAAVATNSINNANFGQVWEWNSLSTSTGLTLAANTTGTAVGGQKLMLLSLAGANSVASRTSYALAISNAKTGTTPINYGGLIQVTGGDLNVGMEVQLISGTNGIGFRSLVTGTTGNNIGGEFTATGGASNIAVAALRGSVNLGTVGTESGVLKFNGSTSGTATITVSAAAGTPTLTLPTTTGTLALTSNIPWTILGSDIYYNTGNVGIGSTSAPTDKLHIRGVTAGQGLTIEGTASPSIILKGGSSPAVYFRDAGGSGGYLSMSAATYDFSLAMPGWGVPIIFTQQATNNMGIGLITPTARLHLPAGTTAAGTAPLKFTSGTNLTAPAAGAMEWDGTNLFITQTTGPTRKTIAYTSDLSGYIATSGTSTMGADVVLATGGNKFTVSDPTNGEMLVIDPVSFNVVFGATDGTSFGFLSANGNGTGAAFEIGANDGTNDYGILGASGRNNYLAPSHLFRDGGSHTTDPSALVQIESTTKGLLIPRMTEAERDAISSPATSLLVFVTDATSGYYYYDGAAWVGIYGNFIKARNVINETINATDADFAALAGKAYVLPDAAGGNRTITLSSPQDRDVIQFSLLNSSNDWTFSENVKLPDGSNMTTLPVSSYINIWYDAANSVWRGVINL